MEISNIVPAPALTAFIREVPDPLNWILNRFLPDVIVDDIEARIDSVTKKNRAAQFRTFDAESPIGARDPFSSSRVTLPPLSEKIPLGEYERLQLERVRSGNANTARVVDEVYNDGENLARSIRARMELARGDVLSDGKFTLQNENGLTLEADFGLPEDNIVAPAVAWNADGATPITDLEDWANQYEDINGERPRYALVSRQARSAILRSPEALALAGYTGGTAAPVTLSQDQLNTILGSRDLPELIGYSAKIDVGGVDVRPIAEDRVVFLPEEARSLGYTAWGITAEALEFASKADSNTLMTYEQLPGLFALVMKETDPVRTWTKVAAAGMPLIEAPRRLLVADIW